MVVVSGFEHVGLPSCSLKFSGLSHISRMDFVRKAEILIEKLPSMYFKTCYKDIFVHFKVLVLNVKYMYMDVKYSTARMS